MVAERFYTRCSGSHFEHDYTTVALQSVWWIELRKRTFETKQGLDLWTPNSIHPTSEFSQNFIGDFKCCVINMTRIWNEITSCLVFPQSIPCFIRRFRNVPEPRRPAIVKDLKPSCKASQNHCHKSNLKDLVCTWETFFLASRCSYCWKYFHKGEWIFLWSYYVYISVNSWLEIHTELFNYRKTLHHSIHNKNSHSVCSQSN